MRQAAARAVIGVTIVTLFAVGATTPAGAEQSVKTPVSVSDVFPSGGGIQFVVDGVEALEDAGLYKVEFTNDSIGPHVLVGFKIPDGWTEADLLTALNGDDPPPPGAFEVGAVFAKPGQTHQKKFDTTLPGTYGYFCPIPTPAGTPHFNLGFVGVFEAA